MIDGLSQDWPWLARALYDLTLDHSRKGFESSNQYYYMPLDLVEKVVNCEFIVAGLRERGGRCRSL